MRTAASRRFRSALTIAALLLAAAPWRAAQETDPGEGDVPTLEPGARGVARTVIQANEIEEIPLRYLGTLKDYIGPGYDVHLVQLEGPVAERVGVAAGMSGSPVYFDGRLIGALAYRFGTLPKEPVAGVTPIENMLDASRSAGSRPPGDSHSAPIGTPIAASGLAGEVREWLSDPFEEMGFVLVGGAQGEALAAADAELKPGSPVGVELVRGDMSLAATGTVTWVDGETVYAFGHPFFGNGPVEMPMVSATVVHTLTDMVGSSKMAQVGQEMGAIVEDRLTAIVGRKGVRAEMIPMELRVSGGDYGTETFRYELVENSNITPLLAGAVVGNSLIRNLGFGAETTMLARGWIRLEGQPDLPLEMAFAGDGGGNPAIAVATRLQQFLVSLWRNRFDEINVDSLELEVDVRPEVHRYRVEAVVHDRLPVRPGQTLRLTCILRPYRGESVRRELELQVPAGITAATKLRVVVGSPAEIERALGRPLVSRMQTASELASVVRVLGDLRSAHRLSAVLLHGARGVVSRGESFEALPPSAQRLLGSVATPRPRPSAATSLAAAEIELDGPVEGSVMVDLSLEPGGGGQEVGR